MATNRDRFEDEKRRIIESCFSRQDADGSVPETYITHLRITEFSTYPSSPPPPQARNPQIQKPRVIIISVRRSGRVCMHKSKENTNGSFSIGKTWNFDDISHIQGYTGPNVDPQQRQWAGDTGFLITIQKSYYWQAQTDKEKNFFIASLIKIYTKYTGGRQPEISGFDARELELLLNGNRRNGASPAPQSGGSIPPPITTSSGRPSLDRGIGPRPPMTPVGSGPSSAAGSPFIPPPRASPGPMRVSQNTLSNSPGGSMDSTRSFNTPAGMRRLAPGNQSQESFNTPFAGRNDDALRPRSK